MSEKPQVWPITHIAPNGRKRVGVLMIGGTDEHFDRHVEGHRQLMAIRGHDTGPYFHAKTARVIAA